VFKPDLYVVDMLAPYTTSSTVVKALCMDGDDLLVTGGCTSSDPAVRVLAFQPKNVASDTATAMFECEFWSTGPVGATITARAVCVDVP
jgi:hypothetical protein